MILEHQILIIGLGVLIGVIVNVFINSLIVK